MKRKTKGLFLTIALTGMVLTVLGIFLMPMVYGIVTALKTETQFSKTGAPWYPASERTFSYEGEDYELPVVEQRVFSNKALLEMEAIKRGNKEDTHHFQQIGTWVS